MLAAVAVAALTGVLAACGGGDEDESPAATEAPAATTAPTGGANGNVVEVVNQDPGGSGKYAFDPSELKFKVGESVTFSLKAQTELHNFSIDDLDIDKDIGARETQELKVTFSEAGEYRFYCLFHEANGMEGTITVE